MVTFDGSPCSDKTFVMWNPPYIRANIPPSCSVCGGAHRHQDCEIAVAALSERRAAGVMDVPAGSDGYGPATAEGADGVATAEGAKPQRRRSSIYEFAQA